MTCTLTRQNVLLFWNGKKNNNYNQIPRLGEAICNDQLVNFLKDDKHKKCDCSSVYYNTVFDCN